MQNFKKNIKTPYILYFLVGILCLLLASISNTYDYDLFARLIVGEHFFNTGWISYNDFLSYTPTHIWYDHEWGSSVVFYCFFKIFGPFGLILNQAILMFITTLFIIKTQKLQKHAYPTSLLFISLFLLLFNSLNSSIIRCQMFSFMFFSITLYLLEKTRIKNSNTIFLFPILLIIWNNLHGGVVAGIGLIILYLFSAILNKQNWVKYFYVLLISSVLLIINPYGYEYLNFLISANTKNRIYIIEWWDIFASEHVLRYYPVFIISMFTVILTFFNSIKNKNYNLAKFISLIVTLYLGIIHVKLLSLTLIVIVSLYYNDLINLFNKNFIKKAEIFSSIIIIVSIFYLPFTNINTPLVNNNKFPYKEVEFLKINNIKGNILTNFGLGSYVSYKLYPNNLIYMDGRYEEVYYDKEFENLKNFELISEDWNKILTEYPTEIIMPLKNSLIYSHLKKQPLWVEIYTGNLCAIFVKKENFSNTSKYINPKLNKKYYEKTAFDNFGKFGKLK